MRHVFIAWALVFAVVTLSAVVLFGTTSQSPEHPFPMSEGTYWLYRGLIRWTHDVDKFAEAEITWRMEVRKFIRYANVQAAVVNGFPFELAWADDQIKPSDSLLIESEGKFYVISHDRSDGALGRVNAHFSDLSGILSDEEMFLKWPLKAGDRFCESSAMARPDTFYCWFVESSAPVQLPEFAGAPMETRNGFSVIYRTMPDHAQFSFVPGVGLTEYQYHHHGTVADTELKLVEFHAPH